MDAEKLIMAKFDEFAQKKLKRTVGRVAAESNIILSFRRSYVEYRTKDDVSDKDLMRIVRAW